MRETMKKKKGKTEIQKENQPEDLQQGYVSRVQESYSHSLVVLAQ